MKAKTVGTRLVVECEPPEDPRAIKDALRSMGVLDRDGDGVFDFAEASLAFLRADFHDICMQHHRRYATGIAAMEQLVESQRLLAAEISELARWVRMPTKLVRDSTGRSVGAKKVPGLGKLH